MASLIFLKRRIQAAQNVSKTTRAMEMVAASKLRKAQEATLSVRPYVEKLSHLSHEISSKITEEKSHPYIEQRIGKTLLIALSPDKGLCGSLTGNLIREYIDFRDEVKDAVYLTVGKKMEASLVKFKNEIIASFAFGSSLPGFEMVYPIVRLIDEYYLSKKVANVKILYTHFTSIFTQTPKITTILPIILPKETEEKTNGFHLFEPSAEEILPSLLKHYLEMNIYRQLLESYVSEQASRMITMQNATNNARDIIEDLKLEYNKSRQAKITSEILDISSAANAKYE
ncbi:MAG: ATP synthase F1 subunit gamma [Candidatus Levybacteria bacterium]|nr:ATP synthase F1 subunit gamma [Candidatus Levybacteria bacterium]